MHLVQPPLVQADGEIDAPSHTSTPPQAGRRTPVYIYLECRWREAVMAKSGEEGSILTQLNPRKASF